MHLSPSRPVAAPLARSVTPPLRPAVTSARPARRRHTPIRTRGAAPAIVSVRGNGYAAYYRGLPREVWEQAVR